VDHGQWGHDWNWLTAVLEVKSRDRVSLPEPDEMRERVSHAPVAGRSGEMNSVVASGAQAQTPAASQMIATSGLDVFCLIRSSQDEPSGGEIGGRGCKGSKQPLGVQVAPGFAEGRHWPAPPRLRSGCAPSTCAQRREREPATTTFEP